MGYCTNYSLEILEIKDKSKVYEEVFSNTVDILEKLDVIDYALSDDTLESYDAVKWYEHEEHMKKLSTKIPYVLFKLSGEGEDSGDIWDKYFFDGKMASYHAEVKVPPFNEFDLK